MRILLVEDDQVLGSTLERSLKKFKYTVDWVKDGDMAYRAISMEKFDLIILDLGLPKISGSKVIQKIRADENQTPVLVLSARDSTQDRIENLNFGANCYMQKPFDLDELIATINAISRTQHQRTCSLITLGPLKLNTDNHQAHLDEQELILSRREFALIKKLIEIPDKVITREQINQCLYGWGDDIDSNTIEVHIHNLRKKLLNKIMIKTVRGVGYLAKAL